MNLFFEIPGIEPALPLARLWTRLRNDGNENRPHRKTGDSLLSRFRRNRKMVSGNSSRCGGANKSARGDEIVSIFPSH
jgi:hypothetical protein